MEEALCDISAFRLYRTPPAVLGLFEPLPIARDQATRQSLVKQPLVQHILGTPLHYLVGSQACRTSAKNIKQHLWKGDLPSGAIHEISGANRITSPEMTLLLMARTMPTVPLALCMYEFCGSFSVFELSSELEGYVTSSDTGGLNEVAGWRQVKDTKGNPTDLWNRPALVTCERLAGFAEQNRGAYGGNNFFRAASMVAGLTRSPLEAEAALLFSLPRRFGGYGFKLETDKVIPLDARARKIYPHEYCVADLYLESADGSRVVDVECQGSAVHAGEVAATSDANRTTALETMGVGVIQITHADVRSSVRLGLIAEHISRKLGERPRPRTPRMHDAERRLRAELPASWVDLASVYSS